LLRDLHRPENKSIEVGTSAEPPCAAITPDGKLIVWTAPGLPLELWDVETRTSVVHIPTQITSPKRVYVSPNGQWALVAGAYEVDLIRIDDQRHVLPRSSERNTVTAAAFSPDNKALAISYLSRTLWVPLDEPVKIRTISHPQLQPTCLEISGNGEHLLIGAANALVRVVNLKQKQPDRTFRGHRSRVTCLVAAEATSHFYSASETGEVLAWDARVEDQAADVIRITAENGDAVSLTSVAYSSDGRRLVCGGKARLTTGTEQFGTLLLFDAQTRRRVSRWRVPWGVEKCRFSLDGQNVFWQEQPASGQKTIRRRPIADQPELAIDQQADDRTVPAATLIAGDQLLISTANGELRSAANAKQLAWIPRVNRGKPATITDLVASDTGSHVLSCDGELVLRLWNVASREEIVRSVGHLSGLPMAISADGRFAAWTTPEATYIASPKSAVQASPETELVDRAPHHRALLFNIAERRIQFVLSSHTHNVTALALSADGRRLASGDDAGAPKLWDTATGNELFSYRAHQNAIRAIAFHPNGNEFSSVGADSTLRIWPRR
jgi:WD40 repeat protein